MKPRKITIQFVQTEQEISILGNTEGLRYLADVCLRIIGKAPPGNHFHLMPEMENLEKGSIKTVVVFVEE